MGKSERIILEYTCDQCGKSATPDDNASYGKFFELTGMDGDEIYIVNPYGPEFNIAPDSGSLAFCSIECCCDYIKRAYGQYVNMISRRCNDGCFK